MVFVLELLCKPKGWDFILIVVNKFLKMAHFITFEITENATSVAHLFFREVVYGVLNIITSDKDVKFISKFWRHLWDKFGTKV